MEVIPSITAYQFGSDFLCKVENIDQFQGTISLTTKTDTLVRRPGDEPVPEVTINKKEKFFYLEKHLETVITLNGKNVNIVKETKENALPMLKEWSEIIVRECEATKEGLKKIDVVGPKTEKEYKEEMKKEYDKLHVIKNIIALQDLFEQIESDSKELLKAKSTLERSYFLQQNVLDGGIREKVEKQANSANNFLRPLGDNRRDRDLCKRFQRYNQSIQEMLKKIEKLKTLLPKLKAAAEKEGANAKKCFWSQESSLESAISAIEQLDNFTEIDINNCLKLFGLLGIPIKHELYKGDEPQNYTDPHNLGVNQGLNDTITHMAPSIPLNQASLWYLTKIRKPFNTLGFDDEITAVVPIKEWNHPLVWKAYNEMSDIAKLQASAHIRGTVAPLKSDRRALGSATLLKMIHLWESPCPFQANIMAELLKTILHNPYKEQGIRHKSVVMAKNMPSSLGPFAKMFFDNNLLKFAGSDAGTPFWRDVVSNSIHWRVNRALQDSERIDVLKHLLNLLYNESGETDNTTPNFEAAYNYANDEKRLLEPSSLYTRVFAFTQAYDGTIKPERFGKGVLSEEEFGTIIAGYDFKLFSVIEVIKGILCKGTTGRLEDGEIKYPHHDSKEDAESWLKEIGNRYTFDVLANYLDPSCGYSSFWNVLVSKDPNAEKYDMGHMDLNVLFGNWKNLLQGVYSEKAGDLIHSIQEIFGIEDIIHKACNTFSNLQNSLQTNEVTLEQISSIYPILDQAHRPSFVYQKQDIKMKRTILAEDFHDVMVQNHCAVLETLIPSHAKAITEAFSTLYGLNDKKKAIAAEHVLGRYCQMQFTSPEAVQQIKHILASGESLNDFDQEINLPFGSILKPVYDVVIDEPLPENVEERDSLKEQIKISLDSIKTNTKLQEWLLQKYDRRSEEYGWEPLNGKIKPESFENISIEILDIFYGGKTHFAAHINFELEHKEDDKNIDDRLMKLNHIFRLALENIDDIFPKRYPISVQNNIIEIKTTKEGETEDSILMKAFREIWYNATNDPAYREELITNLRKESDTPFNTEQQILKLFEDEENKDMDNLKIQIRPTNQKTNNTLLINGLILWPKLTCRLSELPDKWFVSFINKFKEFIPKQLQASILNGFTMHATLFTEGNDCFKLYQEAEEILNKKDDDLAGFFDHFRKNGGTVGEVLITLKACKKHDINLSKENNVQKEKQVEILHSQLKAFVDTTHKEWKDGFRIKFPDVILQRADFEEFIKIYGISQLRKMTSKAFLNKVENKLIFVGDQIWFWRWNIATNYYAHVGIFIGEHHATETEPNPEIAPQNCIIHVAPRKRAKLKKIIKKKIGKINCDPVDIAVHPEDKIFVVRYPEKPYSGEDIKKRALACFKPKMKFHYNGYFGSCETFAARVCGTRSFKELNLQGFLVACEGGKKKLVADYLHDDKDAENLKTEVEKRLSSLSGIRMIN